MRSTARLALIAVTLLAGAACATEPGIPAPREALVARVAVVRQAVEQRVDVWTTRGRPAANPLAELVPDPRWSVAGESVEVAWLYEGVRTDDVSVLVGIRQRLRAWESTLTAAPPGDPARIKATAAEILDDPAYEPVEAASWIEPWIPYLERFFDLLFRPLTAGGEGGGWWQQAAAVVLYGALVLLMTALLVRIVRRRRPREEPEPEAPARVRRPERAADELRRAARREPAPERAAALYYEALLRRLDEQARLPYQAARTNWENAAAADEAAVAELLRQAAARLDRLIYARTPAAADESAWWEATLDRVWQPAGSG